MEAFSSAREMSRSAAKKHCLRIRPSSDSLLSAAYASAKLSLRPAGPGERIWAHLTLSDQ